MPSVRITHPSFLSLLLLSLFVPAVLVLLVLLAEIAAIAPQSIPGGSVFGGSPSAILTINHETFGSERGGPWVCGERWDWTVGFEIEIYNVEFVPCVESVLRWMSSHGHDMLAGGQGNKEFRILSVELEGRGNNRGPLFSKPEVQHPPLRLTDRNGQDQFLNEYKVLLELWHRRSKRMIPGDMSISKPFPGTSMNAYINKGKHNHEVYFQYSVGAPLADASLLVRHKLRMKDSGYIKNFNDDLVRRLELVEPRIFSPDSGICSREYDGFIALVAHHLLACTGDRTHSGRKSAAAAKFYSHSFLVKTNFGDIFTYLTRNLNQSQRHDFLEECVKFDVYKLLGGEREMFKYGARGYCYSLDVYVRGLRNNSIVVPENVHSSLEAARDLAGHLLGYAGRRHEVTKMVPECPLYYGGHVGGRLYVGQWLLALVDGKDITSDRDSELPLKAVFKSMGKQQMQAQGGVLVEFRHPRNRRLSRGLDFPDLAKDVFTELEDLQTRRPIHIANDADSSIPVL